MNGRVATLAASVAMTLVAGTAWGYWTADSTPGGNGASAATSVNQGATPSASASGQSVTVSWAATTLANGQPVGGYVIKRFDSITLVQQTINSACAGVVTSTSCVEANVPGGSWRYSVTPVIGTNWQGAESVRSSPVVVVGLDITPPTNSISLSSVTGGAYLNGGTTLYYRGVAAGSFRLTNAVADAGSGPASSQTTAPVLGAGWTHTPSTVSTPAGGPYVSNTFSWAAGTTLVSTETVNGRDVAGNIAPTILSLTDDSTAPTNGTISYTNGFAPGRSASVTFTTGTDGGSGIATRRLQRAQATLNSDQTCATFGGFNNIGADAPTSPYVDSSLASACYMYRYVVTDRVGNQHVATSADVVKIGYAGAIDATPGLLSHWRLGESAGGATPTSTDSFTGAAGTLLTAHTGELAASWVRDAGSANETISNEGRVYRVSATGGYTVNTASVVPASPHYSVEADLVRKSAVAGDMVGVVGRLTSATTYYMARWEEADSSWNLVKYVSGARTYLDFVDGQTMNVGQPYRVELEMTGTTLNLYVDGLLKVSATDTSISAAGKAGIADGDQASVINVGKTNTTGIHLDNFQVTPAVRAMDSKGTNHGVYVNGVTRGAPGAPPADSDTAASFDGVDDHVQMLNTTGIPVNNASRSVEAWFKTSSSARQVLFEYGTLDTAQEFGLWIDDGGATMTAWGWGAGNDWQFTMPYAVNDGAWHHVVKTYNGTSLTIYIDGVALPSQTATRSTVMNTTYGFGIGAVIKPGDGNSGGFFNGWIDEVSFYTTVLDQTTVSNHYQLGIVPEPVVTATVGNLAYLENGTTAVDATLTVADADSANLTAATVTMTTNYLNGQDTLAFTNQNGITGTWTAGTGVMALSGSATVAQYQTALRSITYNNNSNYPNTSTRTVTFSVSDGTNTSNTASRNIAVTAVNDAPAGADGSSSLNEDANHTFATADFGMTDPTDNGAHSLTAVKVTTLPALGTLKLSGVNVTAGQTVSAANITSGLLAYTPVSNGNGANYSSFTFQVQDNGGTANGGIDLDASANTFTFNVTAVNDAPINSVPATQSTLPNTPRVFSTGNGNLISISDVDVAAGSVQVQLVSTNGTTTLSGTTGLTFSVGDGTADATMTFTGTVAAVNTALSGLSFNPTNGFTGAASLQIVTSDQGGTGTGGTQTDSDTITINVSGRPVINTTVADLAFTENGAAVVLDAGIAVADSDSNITGATVSMTTNYVNGQDTLNFTNQLGITGSWVAGTGVLTLTGTTTPANYQTAMRTITYSNTANNVTSNSRNVNFVASDAIGAGNTASRQIAVSAVNDAPVNSVPAAQSTAVNTAKVFSSGNSNLISISDDATSGSMQVQLVSTNGATTLSGTAGLSFSVGDGTADATMTFTGTVVAVNTALAGLSFNPRAGWVGTASLQIVTSDQGNTGSGGTLTDDDTVAITVTSSLGIFAVNQDIGTTGGSSSYASGTGTYTVTGQGATVSVSAGTTSDTFQFVHTQMTGDGTLTARVTAAGNPSCGTNFGWAGVMMRDSVAVNSIFAMADQRENGSNSADQRYRATAGSTSVVTPTAATVPEWVRVTRTGDSFTTFRSEDGVTWVEISTARTIVMAASIYVGLASTSNNAGCFAAATFTNVSLTTPSVPPVLTASGGTTAHTENVPVVVDSGITVADSDDTHMESGTVTVGTGYTAGQDLLAFTNQNGITGSWSAPTMTLTGSATKAQWATALRSITYNNTSNTPNTGNRTINFVVNDGSGVSNTAAKTVSVAAANDAPVNSVPGAQTTDMNTAKVFSTGNGNLISITDVDAAGGTMQVQLVSTNGATTLSGTTGLTFSIGDGTADATMTFTGSFAAVNAALSGLSFNPTASFTGAASLQIVTADQGNTGSGGTLTDNDTVAITVTQPSYFDMIQATAGLLSHYRLGEATTSADSMAGTTGATLQSRNGEIGATPWTRHTASGTTNAVLTNAGRVRKSGATLGTLYYTSATPANADYTVEADIHFAGTEVTNDIAGVVGRVNTGTTTYYVARYEQSNHAWNLHRVVNNTWTPLGSAAQTPTSGSTHRLSLDMTGTTIRMLVDGVTLLAAADTVGGIAGPGRGGIALGFHASATPTVTDTDGMHLDNFRISPPLADSKGTNHGDYFNGPTLGVTGAITADADTAATFDGVDDYASVPRSIQDDFSIEFWFKSSQNAGTTCTFWWQGRRLVDAEVSGGNSDFGVSLCAGKVIGGIGNATGDASIVSPLTYNDNAWHHVVFTRTKTTGAMQLYVDGASVVSGTASNLGSLTASTIISLGRAQSGGSHYAGSLDEIALYNTVLSAATVSAHEAAGTP